MHCLPVRRNVIVTDEVIDSPSSVVIDEAENRLHAQKAVMTLLIRNAGFAARVENDAEQRREKGKG
jgi:aspartate carbamoyltransferase catalytic subunit